MNWSLRKKLYAAFGSIVALVAILGAMTLQRMNHAQRMVDEQSQYATVAHNAERLMKILQAMRVQELTYFSDYGNDKALDERRRNLETFHELAAASRNDLQGSDQKLVKQLDEVDTLLESYVAAFEAAKGAFLRRGSHEFGLQKEFRDAAHEVEAMAEQAGDKDLTILLLQCRRSEKDFLLRGLSKYKDLLYETIGQAVAHIKESGQQRVDSAQLVQLFANYRKSFDAATQAMETLDAQRQVLAMAEAQIETSLQAFVTESDAKSDESRAQALATQEGTVPMVIGLFAVAILVALGVARTLSLQVSTAIAALGEGTQRLMAGDLNAIVKVSTRDELGELADSFNGMAKALREMTHGIADAVGSTNTTVGELQSTVSEQAASVQQQASSVSETVATVEELSRSAEQVSEVAVRVMQEASESMTKSQQGRQAIEDSVQGMDSVREQVEAIAATILELSEKTQQISGIISTVDDFAEQSSLLALNASIEAARAGEEGKAFGVVAAEVKSLAEQSQQATERVRSILNDIQRATHTAVMVTEEGSKRVDRGVGLVNTTGDVIEQLANAIQAASESAKQIAAAARQQSNGIEQISVAMAGIEQFSKQNVEAIRQTESVAHGLAATANQLESRIAQYRVS